jgi:hypothetical protein
MEKHRVRNYILLVVHHLCIADERHPPEASARVRRLACYSYSIPISCATGWHLLEMHWFA